MFIYIYTIFIFLFIFVYEFIYYLFIYLFIYLFKYLLFIYCIFLFLYSIIVGAYPAQAQSSLENNHLYAASPPAQACDYLVICDVMLSLTQNRELHSPNNLTGKQREKRKEKQNR